MLSNFFYKIINNKSSKEEKIETDDIFIKSDISGITIKSAQSPKKILFLIVIFCFVFILLAVRLFFIQVVNGASYRALADNNKTRSRIIPAPRGIIYDRNGTVLVDNLLRFVLYLDPSLLPVDNTQRNAVLNLAKSIVVNNNEIIKQIDDLVRVNNYKARPILLVDNLDHENALKLFIKTTGMPGMVIETFYKRNYKALSKLNLSLSHILGYISLITDKEIKTSQKKNKWVLDKVGRTGLELQYNHILAGENGQEIREVDTYGRVERVISTDEPIHGNSLHITIDSNLQNRAEQILREHMQHVDSKRGIIVVHNLNNGEILSMVSLPAFDSNDFIAGLNEKKYLALVNSPDKVLFNRAISGAYQPGSIIKPILSIAALEEDIITPTTQINSVGGISVGGLFFPDWKKGGHGMVDVTKAIAESVNSFYYLIGGGDRINSQNKYLGLEAIVRYYELFWLGRKTGIDLPNEQTGFLPTPEWRKSVKKDRWYIGDTYNISIGHGDMLVTPLQASIFTAALANNGLVYKPHFIMKGKVESERIAIPLSQANLDIVKKGMRQAVVYGTARRLNSLPFAVAGKTGTAQTPGNKPPHSWFVGFAPYDKPEVVITVLVEEGGEGSAMAIPIAYEVLSQWYKIKLENIKKAEIKSAMKELRSPASQLSTQ